MTTGQPPALTIFSMYCTGGTECLSCTPCNHSVVEHWQLKLWASGLIPSNWQLFLFLCFCLQISKNPTVLFAEHVRCSTHDTPLWDYGISDLRLGRPWRTTEKPVACTRATSCFSLGGPHQLTNLTGSHSRVYIYGCHVIVVCPGLVFVLNICVYMLINTTNATQVHVIQWDLCAGNPILLRQTFPWMKLLSHLPSSLRIHESAWNVRQWF